MEVDKDIEKFINNIFKKDGFNDVYYERMSLLDVPERIYFMDSIYNMILWNVTTEVRRQTEEIYNNALSKI